ncbi:hypothetical protein BDD43_3510 [Mucilaginibacter gracilis]|uniref:Uncharacterized protein n=1 Tax=Mucilaginibacter gracilis TaxID=423350 RepID=A0A495J2V2_9SPHI|nr:hypothetical protein BDD43_3510 [Mucilaginibacter gracilis]
MKFSQLKSECMGKNCTGKRTANSAKNLNKKVKNCNMILKGLLHTASIYINRAFYQNSVRIMC